MSREGFVREDKDIRYLILFSMQFLPFAVSEKDLLDIVLIDEGFGFFEFAQALNGLVDLKLVAQVKTEGNTLYTLTPKGAELVAEMGSTLRSSVRDKAEQAALRVVRQVRRDASVQTSHTENGDGSYTVQFRIRDGELPVLSLELMAMTRRQCTLLEEQFKRRAGSMYRDVLELLRKEDEAGE